MEAKPASRNQIDRLPEFSSSNIRISAAARVPTQTGPDRDGDVVSSTTRHIRTLRSISDSVGDPSVTASRSFEPISHQNRETPFVESAADRRLGSTPPLRESDDEA